MVVNIRKTVLYTNLGFDPPGFKEKNRRKAGQKTTNCGEVFLLKTGKSTLSLVMIDFSRAFRRHKDLMDPKNLLPCKLDRRFYDGMRELTEGGVNRLLADLLTEHELEGLMARRGKIVSHFHQQIAQKGENWVLCSLLGH